MDIRAMEGRRTPGMGHYVPPGKGWSLCGMLAWWTPPLQAEPEAGMCAACVKAQALEETPDGE